MRLAHAAGLATLALLVLAPAAPAPTEELYGNYNFKAPLLPTDEESDPSPVASLVGVTGKRACVKLRGSGLPAGATAAVSLQRGPAGAGDLVVVFEDAFAIGEDGELKSTQCLAITARDRWVTQLKRRPGQFAVELEMAEEKVVLAGQVSRRRRR